MEYRQRQPVEQAILGFLMQQPLHGYDLHRRVEEELGHVWAIGLSNLYGALKRLEEAGQIESTLTPQGTRPPRKVHHLTPAGRERFLEWVQNPVRSMREVRVEFLAKLYFHRLLGLRGTEALIAGQEAICRERKARLETSAARCAPQDFYRLVVDFRCRQIQAILEWLDACRGQWCLH